MALIESVPNVSEGRRSEVIDACAGAIRLAGAVLLDTSADAAHHRSVYTFAGTGDTVAAAILSLFDAVIPLVDLRQHSGQHPRLGVVDVVPFVPLGQTTMGECVALARSVGRQIAERHDLPVFLYGEAALRPGRGRLEEIRQGGFEGLMPKLTLPDWAPDFGPLRPHPSAGASVVGARQILIAYNVNLGGRRLDVARRIARAIRESSGGLPSVKAMAVDLAPQDLVQVSMNLTDFGRTSIEQAYQAVEAEAARAGVSIVESELVGLAPAAALSPAIAAAVRLRDFGPHKILENALREAGVEEP